ncbi:MAG TPA: hypothetical protein VFC19_51600 [Candidatus Limnocylindrales bacterium]|nr:hypothetical protein [Candidatus Limnocylindrales bacterium]
MEQTTSGQDLVVTSGPPDLVRLDQEPPFGPPSDWTEIELGMSNFDHNVDEGFEGALRAGGVWGRHAAWEFNGIVWFENGLFHEQVWRRHVPQTMMSAASLRKLMTDVNDQWGWE